MPFNQYEVSLQFFLDWMAKRPRGVQFTLDEPGPISPGGVRLRIDVRVPEGGPCTLIKIVSKDSIQFAFNHRLADELVEMINELEADPRFPKPK